MVDILLHIEAIIRIKQFFNRGNFKKRIVFFLFFSIFLTGIQQSFLLDCNNNNNNEYENIHDNEEEDEHKNVFNENDFEINEKVADSGKYTTFGLSVLLSFLFVCLFIIIISGTL